MPQKKSVTQKPKIEKTSKVVTQAAATDSVTGLVKAATEFVAAQAAMTRVAAVRRNPFTADVLVPSKIQTAAFMQHRVEAIQHFHVELARTRNLFRNIANLVQLRPVPQNLIGRLLEPDGSPAAYVQLSFEVDNVFYPDITSDHGSFDVRIPAGKIMPKSGKLAVKVHGSNADATLSLQADKISDTGLTGDLFLETVINPLHVSIIQSLKGMLPDKAATGEKAPASEVPVNQPAVSLGEGKECLTIYRTDFTADRFPFGIFFRLVEPRTSIVNTAQWFSIGEKQGHGLLPLWETDAASSFSDKDIRYIDRVPVEQPFCVDGFRDRIIGTDGGTIVGNKENVPMAGTLGLGYVLQMAQGWTPKGYALGNLVYSLPLAPGEQQRVAIFERTDIAAVRESEMLDIQERQQFEQVNDTSAHATFASAFSEEASGGSSFSTYSKSRGGGWTIPLIASGGGGSSSSWGESSTWMQGVRTTAQSAAEDTHAAVKRAASARRSALRTSMRLAMTAESANVTTKVITNHNHTRALTFQYWEVLRLYEISTEILGVNIVCLVPLEIVRFLPPSQPLVLSSETKVDSREEVLNRYSLVLKHADILGRSLPREYRKGLALLNDFAGDPTATVKKAGDPAEDIIHLSLTGSFLPFDRIFVSAVTKQGARLTPARLSGEPLTIPDIYSDNRHAFATKEDLIGGLRNLRQWGSVSDYSAGTLQKWSGFITLPRSVARTDIVGFEITRTMVPFSYGLVSQGHLTFGIAGLTVKEGTPVVTTTTTLSTAELERLVGGPQVTTFYAGLNPYPATTPAGEVYTYVDLGFSDLPVTLPIAAQQIPPVLNYSQILQIEKMLQHVVRNTVTYSKEVWASLTPEERVIMLEGFTIGVPDGGITDPSQMIPLLNCVENKVLGFYGNSMIMPFHIPPELAESMELDTGQAQEMLTTFHKTAFSGPRSLVALPTRGVLGEAVLGSCCSAEKIDITRFWNWTDAPADVAPEIGAVTLPTTQPSPAAGLTAPSALSGIQPLINNFNASTGSPGVDTGLLQAMVKSAAEQKGFSTADLTGAALLAPLIKGSQQTAESARADALKTVRDMNELGMATAGNIVGARFGNPTAGSDALRALNAAPSDNGKKAAGSEDTKSKEGSKTEKKADTGQPETGGSP